MAYYVINDDKCLFESMTKEEILAAITQAVSTHTISDVDTGFVTTIKERNKNTGLKFWVGSTAEYNAIQTKDNNCFYILTDDTELEDLEQKILRLGTATDANTTAIATQTGRINTLNDTVSTHSFDIMQLQLQYIKKGLLFLNTTVNYGSGQSVNLLTNQYEQTIEDMTAVKVTATGAGEILCTVQNNGDNTIYIKGNGVGSLSSESGAISVFINLVCEKTGNNPYKITNNKSVSVVLTGNSTSITQQAINKIVGVL